jgi:hypothetical protein
MSNQNQHTPPLVYVPFKQAVIVRISKFLVSHGFQIGQTAAIIPHEVREQGGTWDGFVVCLKEFKDANGWAAAIRQDLAGNPNFANVPVRVIGIAQAEQQRLIAPVSM